MINIPAYTQHNFSSIQQGVWGWLWRNPILFLFLCRILPLISTFSHYLHRFHYWTRGQILHNFFSYINFWNTFSLSLSLSLSLYIYIYIYIYLDFFIKFTGRNIVWPLKKKNSKKIKRKIEIKIKNWTSNCLFILFSSCQ